MYVTPRPIILAIFLECEVNNVFSVVQEFSNQQAYGVYVLYVY